MKKQLFAIFFLFLSNFVIAQKTSGQIEINPYMRMDWYPEFSYNIGGRPSTDYTKMRGKNWGLNVNYKYPMKKDIFIKAGLGYYRHSFNKINTFNTMFGNSNARMINYTDPRYIVFTTDKYWYNCISANIGIEKLFKIKNDMQIIGGLNLNNYYTYSQNYHIPIYFTVNPINNNYKLNNDRFFGLSANIHAGLLKKIGKVSIGPSIILPVYDTCNTDRAFPDEDNDGFRNKWFKGIGLGIICNFSLTKK